MRKLRLLLLATVLIGFASSCRKKADPAPTTTQPTALKVEFSNIVGNEAMVLDTKWYINAALDTYKISSYKYYVSNVKLTRADGTIYTEPESYHLIDQSIPESRKFELANVPAGNYNSITFLIGVDAPRNTAGAQTGALAPGNGMFWDWNTGYIMAKMEGISNTTKGAGNAFFLHIAGYDLSNSVLHEVTLNFPNTAVVSGSNKPNVHIFSDANEWFKNPDVLSLATYSFIMKVGPDAIKVANNYKDMFHVDHVDN